MKSCWYIVMVILFVYVMSSYRGTSQNTKGGVMENFDNDKELLQACRTLAVGKREMPMVCRDSRAPQSAVMEVRKRFRKSRVQSIWQ